MIFSLRRAVTPAATPTIIAIAVGAWGADTLSILAKIHFQIHLTVAKVLIHSRQQVRVMIFLFSLLTVFLTYRFEKIVHATPTIMAIAVGALGVGLSIQAKIHFQIHLREPSQITFAFFGI